jgi:hypothetical protein
VEISRLLFANYRRHALTVKGQASGTFPLQGLRHNIAKIN